MKYAIVENEHFALENLKTIVSQLRPGWTLCFTSESVEDTVEWLNGGPDVNLVFMDIELVDGNCFDIFRQTHTELPVIFTTAYDEYAVNAFKVNSVDYLLKPVSEEAVSEALEKFEKYRSPASAGIDYAALEKALSNKTYRKRILTSQGDSYGYLEISDVAYFLSEDKYIFAYTQSGTGNMTGYSNLSQVEKDLDPDEWFHITRNMIVRIGNITGVRRYFSGRLKVRIKVAGKTMDVVVSAPKRAKFLEWYGGGGM